MLPIKNDVRTRSLQDHGDQLCQLSITKHACLWELSNIKLIENLARRRERLNKHSFLVAHVRRHKMQISQWQRQIFRERTIVGNNAEHAPPRPGRLYPTLAKIAHRPKSVSRAGHVDLARHALAYPPLLRLRGNSADFHNLPNKFVPRRAVEGMVSAQYLHIRVANPGQPHPHQGPSKPQLWNGLADLGQLLSFHHKADHLHFRFRIFSENGDQLAPPRVAFLDAAFSAVPGLALPRAQPPAPRKPFANRSATGRPQSAQLRALRL